MKYKVLKKISLFVEENLEDICHLWDITKYSGIVLAQDDNGAYIVFAATKCEPITKYRCGELIAPPVSQAILESFIEYEDAFRMYDYLANIAAQIPLFTLSRKPFSTCYSEQEILHATKVFGKTLVEFMDGVSLLCYISTEHGKDGKYYIFLNNYFSCSYEKEDDFKNTLEDLKNYICNLPEINISRKDLPEWFSVSNQTFQHVTNSLFALHKNNYCEEAMLKPGKELQLSLEKENSFFKVMIAWPRSAAANNNNRDIDCVIAISENLSYLFEPAPYGAKSYWKKGQYEIKDMFDLKVDSLVENLNNFFQLT